MPPKKKQKVYTSLAEQQQLLEDFYNDLDDETFLGHKFGGEGEDESNISCSSSDTCVLMSLIKILILLHNQLMKKT